MVETGREWQSQLLWFLGRNAEQTKISTCFPNVFHFQDEFIAAAMDPDDQMEWFHYHLQKCYTPYMDAVGCVVNVGDKEIQSMKKEAGPEGWSAIQQKFIQDAARTAGETKARMMWEMATNMKEIHEKTRQRDGHLFGEKSSTPPPLSNNNNNVSRASTPSTLNDVAEAMGVSEYLYNKNNGPPTKCFGLHENKKSNNKWRKQLRRKRNHFGGLAFEQTQQQKSTSNQSSNAVYSIVDRHSWGPNG